MTIGLLISGAPRTKKNHGRVIQRGRRRFHIPSDAWTMWSRLGALELAQILRRESRMFPIAKSVNLNCRALFYRDALMGDAVGYYQGLADLLQYAGVLEDDVSLVSWDGSRLLKDADRPRVELLLTVIT